MIVGLTGGIGAGKSTVAQRFAEHGAFVVDADALAREVVQPDSEGLAAVVKRFGSDVLTPDGALDRPALGRVVFGDEGARAELEGILHPRIAELTKQRMAQAAPGQVIIHDIPLLVELQRQADYDLVVVIDAPYEVRVARLMETRGMSRDEAQGRIAAQATTQARRAVADVWIDNDDSPEVLRDRIDAAWERILESAARQC